ncbi:MAG: hypothetical protein ACLQD8_00775 [Thermoplasmata archaeon]
MAVAGSPAVILFVSGEPGPVENTFRRGIVSMGPRMFGILRTPWTRITPEGDHEYQSAVSPDPGEGVTWHVPAQEVGSVEMVRDAARAEARTVTLVNVNAPGAQRDLVTRWVGPDDVLPILVRSDGARLVGIESFTERAVREFVGGR